MPMRTEAEVQRAIKHVEDVKREALHTGDFGGIFMQTIMLDLLTWMLGQHGNFATLLANCDAVDEREKRD